jgi:Zn-dependent metalloprotease
MRPTCAHDRDGARSPLLCIVPPHILEALARGGEPAARVWATRALDVDAAIRAGRLAEPLSTAGPGPPPSTPGPHLDRGIYDAHSEGELPGTLVRSEGLPASGDPAVDEAYDGFGATFALYWDAFERNSIDDRGLGLVGSVHYLTRYDNAFRDGSQMVFGDGDETYFNRFTIAVDVIGHELTHGVTAHEANLAYHDQPGALNESMSDVFGSIVKQYALQQTAAEADWLIGAGLFTARVQGVALRSMEAPGTAYDDPVLGKDPQPAEMSGYVTTASDNGGVHINSGIPNRAFYLAAIALGGNSWERAGHIWYATLGDPRLSSEAQFDEFASLASDNAGRLYGDTERQVVIDAWARVGVTVAQPAEQGAA